MHCKMCGFQPLLLVWLWTALVENQFVLLYNGPIISVHTRKRSGASLVFAHDTALAFCYCNEMPEVINNKE